MPPVRRSARLKRSRAKAASTMSEVDRFYTREKQRREICHKILPPADRDLQLVMSGICSDDSKLQLHSTNQLLNMISIEDNPLLIDEVVEAGAVPILVEFLMRDEYPQLQVAWALGNIAGESPRCRDIVLDGGALSPLLTLCEKHNNLSFLRIGTWTLTNIFEGKPKVPFEQCKGGIGTTMFEADLCLKLAYLFGDSPLLVLFPALRAIVSIMDETEPAKLDMF